MRKLALFSGLLAGLVLLMAFSASAQDTSRFQADGGFLYTRYYPVASVGTNCVGGYGQGAFFFFRGLAAVADIGGCGITNLSSFGISGSLSSLTYLFGPEYAWRKNDRLEPFIQVLFGGIHISGSGISSSSDAMLDSSPALRLAGTRPDVTTETSDPSSSVSVTANAFAMTAGGGLDIKVTKMIAIRAIQVNYLLTHGGGTIQSGVEIKAGVTVRLGGH